MDAFGMNAQTRDQPPRFWPRAWKQGQDHLMLSEQDRRQRLSLWSSFGLGWLAWAFLAITVLLAILTAQAFAA